MRRALSWIALLSLALTIKVLFVDRYFPEMPGNMLIWLPITVMIWAVVAVVILAYMVLIARHREK